MGCWSEACAISGMEIQHGDECLISFGTLGTEMLYDFPLILHSPYFLGTYDDYGGVDLLEDYEPFGFKVGDNLCQFDDRQIDHQTYDERKVYHTRSATAGWVHDEDRGHWMIKGHRIFIHKKVFDLLGDLEPEWTYHEPKTIALQIDKWLNEKVEQTIKLQDDAMKEAIEIKNEAEYTNDETRWKDLKQHLLFAALRAWDKIGLSRRDEPWENFAIEKHGAFMKEFLKTGQTIDWNAFFKDTFFIRSSIIRNAADELRKTITPGQRGPQHGGEQALIPFYEGVLAIAKERKAEWDKEYGDEGDEDE